MLGILLGNFYVFSGYGLFVSPVVGSNVDSGEIDKTPRIKNLKYVFTGAVGTLVINWEPILGQISPILIFTSYLFGCIFGLSTSILWVKRAIELHIDDMNANLPENSKLYVPRRELVLEYLHYGYSCYKDRVNEYLSINANQQDIEHLAGAFAEIQARTLNHLGALDSLPPGTELAQPDILRKAEIHGSIIDTIKQTVHLFSEYPDHINVNVTILVFQKTIPDQYLFKSEDLLPENCIGVLRLYNNSKNIDDQIYVPVGKAYDNYLLPGAPEAYVRRDFRVFEPKDLAFKDRIPESIRVSMEEYFSSEMFEWVRSVTCIPFFDRNGEGQSGVINIESSEPHLVDDEQRCRVVVRTLQPLVFLLSKTI